MPYLIDKGHTRIGIIAGHPHSYPASLRMLGYQLALQEAGLPMTDEYIRYGNWKYGSGIEQSLPLLTLIERPTAIFAMNDLMSAGCIHALNANNLSVPKDMTVIGFDNRKIAQYLQPPLTTVALPTVTIGVHAAKHILNLIQNHDIAPQRDMIPCSVIERLSV